jgi:hypothetical protein
MGMVIGFIIGAAAGLLLSNVFIFPNDLLSRQLVEMTIGDILRILGGLVVIPLLGGIGGKMFSWFVWAVSDFKIERSARIEQYGKWGSNRYRGHLAKRSKKE